MTAAPRSGRREIPFFDLRRALKPHVDELLAAADAVLNSGWLIRGNQCRLFDEEFARYCGANHSVGVGNGLDALALILASDIEAGRMHPGDEILVPAHTFIATVLAVSHAGLKPVLVDVDDASFNIDPAKVAEAVGPRTRGILCVHLYGRCCDMDAINGVARSAGLRVYEDAAQAHGARYRGRTAGSLGDAAGFSFYPTKNLGAIGDGGAVVSDDADVVGRVRVLSDYGSPTKYVTEHEGCNSRLDELQAAFLRTRLAKLDEENERRRSIAARYITEICNPRVSLPNQSSDPGSLDVWHLFVVRTDERDRFRAFLADRGIQTAIHYPRPPHRQPVYAGRFEGEFPVADAIAREVASLPLSLALDDHDVRYVIDCVNDFK